MKWLKRNNNNEAQHDKRVEVSLNKESVREAAIEAKEANNKVYNLIEQNNFHIVLFKAFDGKVKERKT